MKYMGSKSRIVKYIVPILQDIIDKEGIELYVEPFVGGANVIDKIKCKIRVGNDINPFLIELLKAQQKGLLLNLPEVIKKEHYDEVRNLYNIRKCGLEETNPDYEDWYIGAIGFLSSYNGRFFDGGYMGIATEKTGITRNYFDEAKRNLIQQDLQGIKFYCSDYSTMRTRGYKALVYCDPPYAGTKQYNYSKNFDHGKFWEWVRLVSKEVTVLVSEQTAPDDFEIIWEQPITRSIGNRTSKDVKNIDVKERLFKWKGKANE